MNDIVRLTRSVKEFLQTEAITQFEARVGGQKTYLLSFPRSGNGFIRFVMAKILLAANGFDTAHMEQEVYVHSKAGQKAQRFVFPASGQKVSVEEIVPDFHMNDDAWFGNLAPDFYFGEGPLIKTHAVVASGVASYIYLYRDPLYCTVSYFNLAAPDDVVAAVLAGQDGSLFIEAVSTYLDVYTKMGEMALAHARTGQCRPLALHRIEADDFAQFTAIVQNNLPDVSSELIHRILRENRKASGFKKDLMDMVGPELDVPLKRAQGVFDQLNTLP